MSLTDDSTAVQVAANGVLQAVARSTSDNATKIVDAGGCGHYHVGQQTSA